ncbi:MAG: biopolymer transporter ExbD [Bacteroidia bacterium]|jgi:biopolymer transport protein ExbD|nr:biopolymer transporter ExbD [Sphingobacteriaceae bacterium]MBK7816677.1 biopolymer transporter ExbD [Sphingobacteriaceae bacterium]MBP9068044.1 biopolymer transporter ExbD [Bacteroidia bacterium]
MAEIQEGGGGGHKGGKKRAKKQSTRIDMTPMVDLAFLLLTFFVLTATFSKPKSMELTFPAPPPIDKKQDEVKNGITFLLSKDDRIFYYEGELKTADDPVKGPKTVLTELNFSRESLRKYLLDKNKEMQDKILVLKTKFEKNQMADTTYKRLVREVKADQKSYTYLIKTDDKATFKNVIDVIDELNYNAVGKYVMVDILKTELDLVTAKVGI